MNARINIASVISLISVLALYIETILQIAVIITSETTPVGRSPIAVTSLCTMGLSFLSTSVASFSLARSSVKFDDGTLKAEVVFRFLHLFQFGLVWRIFKLISSFTGSNVKCLSDLRLVHVAIQSLPYIVIYSTTFLIKGKINALQSISLMLSVISSAIAVSCYILRRKYCRDETQEEDAETLKTPSNFKSLCAVFSTLLGTLLVLFARSASVTLMAAQVRLWVLIPLSFHFLLIFVVFCVFSSQTQSEKPRMLTFTTHLFYCIGMSILNSFDLVYDNIAHVMCKYVAFYSLLLIENIIFVSFWLLNFDLDYVSKLVTVLGILSGFIIGLIIKFTGCTLLHRDVKKSPSDEDLSQVPLGLPSIATTPASATLSLRATSAKKEDDLISIVQASLAHHAHRSERLVQQSSTNQMVQLSSAHKSRRKKKSSRAKPIISPDEIGITNATTAHDGQNTHPKGHLQQSVQNPPFNGSSIHRSITLQSDKLERPSLPDPVDQNDSFQHSSIFSVSDPETLLSDMMYDEVGGEGGHQRNDSFDQSIENQHLKSIHRKELELPKLSTTREINRPERLFALDHPSFQSQAENFTAKKGRSSKVMNMTSVSKGADCATTKRPYVSDNQPRDMTHPNDSSDTALSSAKTFPCESRKGVQKGKGDCSRTANFDEKMKNILSSIEDENKHTSSDEQALPYRFSDSETLARNKAVRMPSVNSNDRRACKNIISYTGDDGDVRNFTQVNRKTDHSKFSSHRPKNTDNIQGQRGNVSKDMVPAQRILASNVGQLCESGSSSFTTTMNGTMTQTRSSSSTTMTTEDCWHDGGGQSSDAKSDRLSQFILQSDISRISPSENILRWLSTTSSDADTG